MKELMLTNKAIARGAYEAGVKVLSAYPGTPSTEIAEYFKRELGYDIPPMTPFVGDNFNVTRAGIHADGLLKNEEIYNIFDTDKFLKRPPIVSVSNTSGLAGIAHWVNTTYGLKDDKAFDKSHPLMAKLKETVDREYDEGRVTVMTDDELFAMIHEFAPEYGLSFPEL